MGKHTASRKVWELYSREGAGDESNGTAPAAAACCWLAAAPPAHLRRPGARPAAPLTTDCTQRPASAAPAGRWGPPSRRALLPLPPSASLRSVEHLCAITGSVVRCEWQHTPTGCPLKAAFDCAAEVAPPQVSCGARSPARQCLAAHRNHYIGPTALWLPALALGQRLLAAAPPSHRTAREAAGGDI